MGFLDKLKTVAATAKDGLEKSGLMDQLTGSAEDPSPDLAAWDPDAEMASVIRWGGLDPRSLIMADEVADVAGHGVEPRATNGPFQSHGLCFESSFVDINYEGSGEVHTLSVFHAESDEYPWDADVWFDSNGTTDTETVVQLGERAFALYANVYVQQSGHVLGAVVTGDRVTDERSRTHAIEMLRIALARL